MRTTIVRPQFLPAPDPRDPLPNYHGALLRSDAEKLLGRRAVAEALAEGEWVEIWHGVLVPGPLADDPRAQAAAALLRAGDAAVLCGPTAVAVHGCGPIPDDVHICVPFGCEIRSKPGLAVRQRWIYEPDVVLLDGFRVYALEVAVGDMLCSCPQRQALDCLERAMASLGDQAERFRALVAEKLHRRRDRRGTRRAYELLDMAWVNPELAGPAQHELVATGSER